MKHTLTIQLRAVEGAIIRALGLVERRGFRIDRVEVGEPTDGEVHGDGYGAGGAVQAMRLVVEGERPVALLQRQLERLHDVLGVETAGGDPAKIQGAGAPNWSGAAVVRPVTGGN